MSWLTLFGALFVATVAVAVMMVMRRMGEVTQREEVLFEAALARRHSAMACDSAAGSHPVPRNAPEMFACCRDQVESARHDWEQSAEGSVPDDFLTPSPAAR